MHIADMPYIPDIIKQQAAKAPVAPVATAAPAPQPAEPAKPTYLVIKTAADLADALQASKEILLYSYYSSNIEISSISDGELKYFDRKGDADFQMKLASWLMDKTGRQWKMERLTESSNTQTFSEQKQQELESDPMIANAMNLFEGAEIVGVSK